MTTKTLHTHIFLLLSILALGLGLAACTPNTPATPAPAPTASPTSAAAPTAAPEQSTPTLAPTATPSASAQVNEVVNEIRARTAAAEDFRQVAEGEILPLQGELQSGENSQARLDILPDGTVVHVGPNTHLLLDELAPQDEGFYTRLRLWAGNLWIVLNGGQLDVETPNGVASVRGSYMSVSYDAEAQRVDITCLEGHCVVENAQGSVKMSDGQASSIPAPGLPPAEPRQMTPEEYQEWQETTPDAAPYIPPEDELPSAEAWLYVDAYNGCLSGEMDAYGVGEWQLTFRNLADGASESFALAAEEMFSTALPAGAYSLQMQYPDGSQRTLAVGEADFLYLDRCQTAEETMPHGEPGPEEQQETSVTIVNTCEDIWYWDFSGPIAFSIALGPGETYSELLPPGEYYALRWWENNPDQVEEITIPAGSDYYSASSCNLGAGDDTTGGSPGTEPGSTPVPPTELPVYYYLENPCPVTWFWKFVGPTTIQFSIAPGQIATGELLPVGTYMGYDWYDVAAPLTTESGPFSPGSEIYVIASCNY